MKFYLRSVLRDGAGGGAADGGAGGGGAGAGAGAGGAGAGAGGSGQGAGQGQSAGVGGQPGSWDIRQHVDDGGRFKPGWAKAAGLPETYEQKYTEPLAALRGMEQAQKLVGANKVAIPGPNATADEKSAFFKALGRPDTSEGYELKKPTEFNGKPIPEGVWDDKNAAEFSKWAHERGWSKQQVHDAVQFDLQRQLSAREGNAQQQQAAYDGAKTSLQKEWGADFTANMQAAERGAAAAGLTAEVLKANPQLSNDPHFIRAMAKVGAMVKEGPGIGTRQQAGENQPSRADAAQRGRELTAEIARKSKADRTWASSPEATRLKAEKSRMFQLANPA